jgi:hypothetical protein
MAVSIIEHKGRNILYSDFSNIKTIGEGMAMLEESDKRFQECGDNVRHLLNFENAVIFMSVFERSKVLGKKNMEKCLKDAFVGVTNLRAIFLKGYLFFTGGGQKARVFNNMAEAMDWLAEGDDRPQT